MAINRGPKISTNGLVLSYDIKDAVSFPNQGVNTMYNLVNTGANTLSSYGVGDSASLSWANNITAITISLLLEKTATTTTYAYHPVNKWDATLEKTSFVLYHFGNYQSNGQDGVLGWYAGGGGSWKSLCFPGTMTVGKIWHLVLQYNSVTGAQGWTNGVKVGGRGGNGVLGSGSSNGSIGIHGPIAYDISRVHQISFYNRELSDSEIIDNYNLMYKSRVII